MFSTDYELTWGFHHNTCRWPYNVPPVPEAHSPLPPYKEYVDAVSIALPDADLPDQSFQELIKTRYSCRTYQDKPLSLADLSAVLRAGYGVNNVTFLDNMEFMERPVPSGGGLYPLELYVLVRSVEGITPGVYHYAILPATLELVRLIELPPAWITRLFMNQSYIANSNAIVLTTAVLERTMWKYGDRGYRYILFEAGHVAQNMNLAALTLGLGTINLGGFFDDDICTLLDIDNDVEIPLYGMALGHPADRPVIYRRMPDGGVY